MFKHNTSLYEDISTGSMEFPTESLLWSVFLHTVFLHCARLQRGRHSISGHGMISFSGNFLFVFLMMAHSIQNVYIYSYSRGLLHYRHNEITQCCHY